nr:mechanosensitive ion channel family protein [uncultured Caproiciproducens sp.]
MGFSLEKYGQQIMLLLESSLPKLIGALLILGIGWWLSNQAVRLMFRAMSHSKTDTGLVTFISSLTRALLKIIVCITAAAQLGMNVSSIIAALGAAGLAIGLALKDNMANIACGAQIIFTKPFRVGDYIAYENTEGTVERIETMFTTLRTFDNKEVVIPNSKITSAVIINYSAMATRRLDLKYSVGYGEDLAVVKRLLADLTENNPMALKDPEPLIVVGEHRESGVIVEVRVWCNTGDYLALYFDMQEKVKLAFDEAGIRIPYNQLDVHMKPLLNNEETGS